MTNNLPESGDQARKKPNDLEERTALFGESVIDYLKKVPVTPVTRRLVDQLVGAGTSIGANYCEADDAVSKKDFRHKIFGILTSSLVLPSGFRLRASRYAATRG